MWTISESLDEVRFFIRVEPFTLIFDDLSCVTETLAIVTNGGECPYEECPVSWKQPINAGAGGLT